jgi:uncharacterized membrane protein YbhN (UPF0104 family)
LSGAQSPSCALDSGRRADLVFTPGGATQGRGARYAAGVTMTLGPARRPDRFSRAARLGVVLVVGGGLLGAIGAVAVGHPLQSWNPTPAGLLVVTGGLAVAASGGAALWWALLTLAGARRDVASVVLAWCSGTPAKYLPGKVGSVIARVALLDDGADRALLAATATAEVLLTLAVGAGIAVGVSVGAQATSHVVALAVGLWSVGLVLFARRRLAPAAMPPVGLLPWFVAVIAPACGWLGHGVALAGALVAVGGEGRAADVPILCGVAGAAGLAGVLGPTPAGIGTRDAVLAMLLIEFVDDDAARVAAAVLLWRIASVVVELAVAAGTTVIAHRRRLPTTEAT